MQTDNKPLIEQGWIRAAVYVILSLVGLMAVMLLLYRFIPGETAGEQPETILPFLFTYLALSVFLVGLAFLFRRNIDRQPIVSMGFQRKGYGSHAAAGFFLGVLLLTLGSLLLVLLRFLFFTGVQFSATGLLQSLLLFIVVAFTEEIAFRGYILNNLMQSMNKWVALGVSALLFALFHASNAGVSPLALLNIFVAGILIGINYVFTRNLWFAIFLHFSWNFFQGPILGFEVSGLPLEGLFQQTLKGPDLLTGGVFGFEGSLVCLVLNTMACVLLGSYYAGYRRKDLREPSL